MASPPNSPLKSDIERLEAAIREGISRAGGSGRPEAVLREHVQPVLAEILRELGTNSPWRSPQQPTLLFWMLPWIREGVPMLSITGS